MIVVIQPKDSVGGMGTGPRLYVCALVVVILVTGAAEAARNEQETIYDVLKKNGLPAGLLPKSVKSYTLQGDGQLEVYLEKPCYAKFENQVYFERMIKGNLSYGQLAGVAGVEQQELFLWFPVKGIRVDIPDSGFIYFDVGVIYKQFSLSLFESPPECKQRRDEDVPVLELLSDRLSQAFSGRISSKADGIHRKALK